MMSVAILKKVSRNVPKIFDFSFIFQEADVLKFSLFAANPETYEKSF